MFCAGIDAGSRAIKIVILDGSSGRIAGQGVADQGVRQSEIAGELFGDVLKKAGVSKKEIAKTVGTGYGRHALDWVDDTVTEITCHARGVKHLHPGARSVIDIGGQDSKMIFLDDRGTVRDFVMNDRCAAGTGRFLEVVSERLKIDLGDLGLRAARAQAPSLISSMCVVFAETEIVGLLATGESPENIVAGVQKSIARRIVSMAGRTIGGPVFFTGGVALIPGMAEVFEDTLGCPVAVTSCPQMTGALGAALIAAKRYAQADPRPHTAVLPKKETKNPLLIQVSSHHPAAVTRMTL
jgi:predicted CoA-substrate-specific enzyme activase